MTSNIDGTIIACLAERVKSLEAKNARLTEMVKSLEAENDALKAADALLKTSQSTESGSRRNIKRHTEEQKRQIIEEVEKNRAAGVCIGTTLQRLGLSRNMYAEYKKQEQNGDLKSKAYRSGRKRKSEKALALA